MPRTNETPSLPAAYLDARSTDDNPDTNNNERDEQYDSGKRVKLDSSPDSCEDESPIGDIPKPGENMKPSGSNSQVPIASGSDSLGDHDERAAMEKEDTAAIVPLDLVFSWRDESLDLQIDRTETIGSLKVMIYSLTAVLPERQKILGLVPGKLPSDDVLLSTIDFKLKRGAHFKLLGTPEENTILRSHENPGAGDDQASKKTPATRQDCVLYFPQVQAKLEEISAQLEINIMNPPRPGKKLLVLDLDYTLMDSKAYSDFSVHALDMARPYLHQFLTALWPYYDICIWSATSWRWLESKLVELGMVGGKYSDKYLIQFVLDRGPMFEVTSLRHGKVGRHEVKALELIWRKMKEYNATNTIHLDDLSRNFVLNPTSGVKISPFKYARENKHDRQLVFLTRYFLQLALQPDIRAFDHRHWASCSLPLPPGVKDPLSDLDPQDPELIKFLHRHSNKDEKPNPK